ncbi:translocation/assembly module TamB domain-containing protein [Desertibaculum subflavum]|uniref:translocation/assembly module TamB domain-containing protein n=1 Tax=Desertibaculum subflavum TaxID=2268458 RepID=UPI000E662192
MLGWLRPLAVVLAWIAAALAVLLACLAVATAVPAGRAALARLAALAVSAATDIDLEIDDVSRLTPVAVDVGRIGVAMRGAPVAEVDGLHVRMLWTDLLRGHFRPTAIHVERLAIETLPAGGAGEEEPAGFRIALPLLPAEGIHVDRLQLGAAILGEAMELRVAAMERAVGGEYVLDADVQRVDRPGDGLVLHARYRPDAETLTIQARAEEAAGGPLARRLGAAPEAALQVELDGAGPISAWRGRLAGGMDGIASIKAEIGIDRGVGAVAGEAWIEPALLPELAPLLREAVTYRARLRWSAADGLRIDDGELRLGEIALDVAGTVAADLTDLQLQVGSDLRLAALSPVLGTELGGNLGVLLHVTGAPSRPGIAADLALTAPRVEGVGVERALLRVDMRPRGDGRFGVRIEGRATDVVGAPETLAPLLAGAFDLAAMLDIAGDASDIRVAQMSVRGPALVVEGDGVLRPSGGDSRGRITLGATIPEAASVGPANAGQATWVIEGGGDMASAGFRARTTLDIEKLALADPALGRAVGDAPRLTAELARAPGRPLQVAQARLQLAAGTVTASGSLDADGQSLEAEIAARVPDLARLSELAGQALAGRADLTAHVSGPIADPAARGQIKIADLAAASQRIERGEIAFDLGRLVSEPQGEVAIDARIGGNDIKMAARMQLRDGQQLELAKLRASAPGLSADGDLALDLPQTLARGRLSIEAADLNPLATLAGLPLAGRAQAALRLDTGDGKQQVAADVTATGLRYGGLLIRRIEGQARLDDALGTPRGELTLTGRDVAAGEMKLDRVEATMRGNLARAAFDVSLVGTAGAPISARASGTAGIDGPRWQVGLTSFEGRHGEIDIKLDAATELSGNAGEFRLAETGVSVGGTRLSLAGTLAGGQVDARLRSGAFPLALLRAVQPGLPLRGHLAIEGTATGSASDPRISLAARSDDLRWRRGETAVAFDLEAALSGGRLGGRATIGNLAAQPLIATAALPLRLSLVPWRLDLPPDGRLDGRLDGKVDLAKVLPPFVPDGDEVEGVATLQIVLGGTLSRPTANGGARLTGARYENAVTEAAVTDLSLELAAEGGVVQLSAHGGDGDSGTVRLDGTLNLAAAEQPIAGRLALRDFWVARRADATVRMSGDVDVAGTIAAPRLAGKLAIQRADLRLPEQLPPEVVELDVIEINRPPDLPSGRERPSGEDGSEGLRIGLDLAVSADRRVFVRGRALQSEWSGNLQIRGTTQAPEISGTLQALNGQLDFIGQRFVLSRGRLLFPGGARINPDLDIVTELTRGDITAIVTVGGTLDAPSLTLGARPDMPPEEVISRMLFDRGTARLTPLQAFQVAQAALSLARGGSGGAGIVDRLRRATGLDVLDFESAEGEGAAGAVSVGKYVSDNVLIRAEKGLDSTGPRAGIEVEVTPNISVESKVGANAATSVGVKIKKDY